MTENFSDFSTLTISFLKKKRNKKETCAISIWEKDDMFDNVNVIAFRTASMLYYGKKSNKVEKRGKC